MNKYIKKVINLLLCFIMSLAFCGCNVTGDSGSDSGNSSSGTGEDKITYSTYGSYWFNNHGYKVMPVGAYNSLPPAKYGYTKNFLTDENIFIDYAEAGVNTLMGLTDYVGLNQQDVLTALDYAYEYGMAYLLAYSGAADANNSATIKSTLSRVMYHDSFAGIMLSDEPGKVMFEKLETARNAFSLALSDVDGKLYHVNLFPTYASSKQLWFRSYASDDVLPVESYSYEQYLKDYMQTYNPQVLSYDFYPITGSFPKLANGYFENMSVIRSTAAEANIPFWTYIQTCSFANGQRLSTQADLNWNVNTCLAYGAKGIQYFCGVNPMASGGEHFNGSMFDVNGNKTEMYDRVKNINKTIAAVDEYLMCAKSKGVIVAGVMPQLNGGENRMSIPEKDLLSSFNELSSVVSNHALVGCFDYNGKTALYVVNNAVADDTVENFTANTDVTLTFGKSVSGTVITAAKKTDFNGTTLTENLDAGEAFLVVLN